MNPHRSKRLVYTAFDLDKHDAFFFAMHNDPVSWTNACSQIQRPMTRTFHDGILRSHSQQLLFVVVNRVVAGGGAQEEQGAAAKPAPETLEPVGKLVLEAPDPTSAQHDNTELSIGIHRDFQGQGYGAEALGWVLDWAFNYANMHRVGLTVYGWNEGAYALYKRSGSGKRAGRGRRFTKRADAGMKSA